MAAQQMVSGFQGNPTSDLTNSNNNAPFLEANQGIPYNFQVSDIGDTKCNLYFATCINSKDKNRKRRVASFAEITSTMIAQPEHYKNLSAEDIKNQCATFLGVGTGNVIKHKTSAKGIASMIIKNRVETYNYWYESHIKAGYKLFLIVKKEKVHAGSGAKAWVFVPYAGNKAPLSHEMEYEDDDETKKMGCSIFIGDCNDDHFDITGSFRPQAETRAKLLNSCVNDKMCGIIEVYL